MNKPFGLLAVEMPEALHCHGLLIDGVKHTNVVSANDIEGWADVLDLAAIGEARKNGRDEFPIKRVTGTIEFLWDNADTES